MCNTLTRHKTRLRFRVARQNKWAAQLGSGEKRNHYGWPAVGSSSFAIAVTRDNCFKRAREISSGWYGYQRMALRSWGRQTWNGVLRHRGGKLVFRGYLKGDLSQIGYAVLETGFRTHTERFVPPGGRTLGLRAGTQEWDVFVQRGQDTTLPNPARNYNTTLVCGFFGAKRRVPLWRGKQEFPPWKGNQTRAV